MPRRYGTAARELAESAFLAHPTGVTVRVLDGGMDEQIEENFPPRENVRGFSVLFDSFTRTKNQPASRRLKMRSGSSPIGRAATSLTSGRVSEGLEKGSRTPP